MFKKNLFSPDKLKYVTGGERPAVSCILCAVAERDPRVVSLEVYRNKRFIVSVNLYPFNAGHLIIFPIRHVETLHELTGVEVREQHSLLMKTIDTLEEVYKPGGFNVGYNIGKCSGASIPHLHMHILPRYDREIGFIDIIGGAKLIVEHPETTMEKLQNAFSKRKK